MAPAPLAQEIGQYAFLFNILSIIIDVAPLLILCQLPNWENVEKYFSLRSFVIGAFVNFMTVCHILFVLEPKDHLDSLFVAITGMCLGTVCAYLCLLHKLVVDRSYHARVKMLLLMVLLLLGSSCVLCGIGEKFDASEGWGTVICVLAGVGTFFLNEWPFLKAAIADDSEVQLDLRVDRLGMVMSFLNMIDGWYFVAFASFLGTFGSLLSIICFITAVNSMIMFCLLLWKMH